MNFKVFLLIFDISIFIKKISTDISPIYPIYPQNANTDISIETDISNLAYGYLCTIFMLCTPTEDMIILIGTLCYMYTVNARPRKVVICIICFPTKL